MIYYYGDKQTNSYFEGWYLKCQTKEGRSLALIPAMHIDGAGNRTISIQVITREKSWWLPYPANSFSAQTELFRVQIGENVFSALGVELCIHADGIDLEGRIVFGPFCPLRYPIMGPFQFIPNMECAHSVISMKHDLKGEARLNGACYNFNGGIGYIESDRGSSFPSSYFWAQDVWEGGSLMLSIAEIPLEKLNFTGCIGAVFLNGKEYRIATYLGAKVKRWSADYAEIRQGRYLLEVEVLQRKELPLKAPCTGEMIRTIHESLCSALRIRFFNGKKVLLTRITNSAGLEYADANKGKSPG